MIDPRAENCRSYSQDSTGLVTGVEIGITIVANSKYEVYKIALIDEVMQGVGGNTIATCSVLDSKGVNTGDQVRLTWPGKNVPFADSGIAGNGANVHVIVNKYNPPTLGPLALHVGEFNKPTSDIVYGLGLPFGHHVSFVIIFIERGAVVTVPTDPYLADRLTKVEAELIERAKAEIIDDAVDITQSTDITELKTKSMSTAQKIAAIESTAAAMEKARSALWVGHNAQNEKFVQMNAKLTALASGYAALNAQAIANDARVIGIRESLDMQLAAVDLLTGRVDALESPQGGSNTAFPQHRMGVHLIGNREGDLLYIAALNPAAVKIVNPDPEIVRRVLATVGPNCVVVLRDHPMSEQKNDMKIDPVGTGKRHAEDWFVKLTSGRFKEFGGDPRIAVVGINEPDVHNIAEESIVVQYTTAFLKALTAAGIRGLALNLSVGWPRSAGPGMPPIWDSFLPLEPIILAGDHFLCVHEYFYPTVKNNWGWYANRIDSCPMSVPVIIGEVGYTRQLANLPQPWGFIGNVPAAQYADMLWEYHDAVSKSVYAIMPFTSGYASADWASKDILLAAPEILSRKRNYAWPQTWPVKKGGTVEIPPTLPGTSDPNLLIFPKFTGLVSGFYGSLYKNAAGVSYAHEGLDLRKIVGSPVVMPYDGVIAHVGPASENSPYGLYIRTYHKKLNVCFFYGHLSETKVKDGDVVKQGTVIGLSGNTGNSSGPHEHCEVRFMVDDQLVYSPESSAHSNARGDIISYMRGFKSAGGKFEER